MGNLAIEYLNKKHVERYYNLNVILFINGYSEGGAIILTIVLTMRF